MKLLFWDDAIIQMKKYIQVSSEINEMNKDELISPISIIDDKNVSNYRKEYLIYFIDFIFNIK